MHTVSNREFRHGSMSTTQTANGNAAPEVAILLNDKVQLRKLQDEINAHLEVIARRFGLVKLTSGRIVYQPDGLSAKITVEAEALSPDGQGSKEKAFLRYADIYGLKPEHLHKEFTLSGKRYQLIGFDEKRRKRPFLIKDLANQKTYLLTPDQAKLHLNR